MNVNDYLIHTTDSLTAKWESYEHLHLKERSKLYQDTQDLFEKLPDDAGPDLQEKIDELRNLIFEGGFDNIISKKYPVLSGLLKKSSDPSLHHLLSADYLKELTPSIYTSFSLKELLAMRQTSKSTKNLAELEIIRRINESAPKDLNSMQTTSRSLHSLMEENVINRMSLANGNVNINPSKSDAKARLDLSKLKISTLKQLRSFFSETALKGLTYLDVTLEPSKDAQSVSQLIAENLIEITECCPSLQVLTLRDRQLLSTTTKSSGESPDEAKSKKSKPKSILSKFSLSSLLKKKSGSPKENDVSLSEKSNPLETGKTCSIKILELSYIKEIGENKLSDVDFLKLCPELEQLSLEGCAFINDTKGLAYCEKLKHLDVRRAFKIDNLEAAVHNCLNLEVIDIQGLNSIPYEQLEALELRNVKFILSL